MSEIKSLFCVIMLLIRVLDIKNKNDDYFILKSMFLLTASQCIACSDIIYGPCEVKDFLRTFTLQNIV